MDDNYINLMEKQPVSSLIQGSKNRAQSTTNQYVIKKINDKSKMTLSELASNDNKMLFTSTPVDEWLTFEFTRGKERLLGIEGRMWICDEGVSIECQYLDQKQWKPCFYANFDDILEQKINPPLAAWGIRFRASLKVLRFINLKIFAKAGGSNVKQENPWENTKLIHNKYDIVNLMNFQTFYKKIDNMLVAYKRPVITKTFDASKYDNEEITNNVNQDISQWCSLPPQWLTYEFDRKYKLSKIQIQLYNKDRRKYEYKIEVMNKRKLWIQVDSGRNGQEPIEVEFVNFYPCYGVRIQGAAPTWSTHGIVVVSMKIFAQRGNPRIIQG